jgi:hypothetical protein
MTTATEKKANAAEQQDALSKLPIPHVNPKQVDKAVKALEKVADKGKAVPGDQPKSLKVVNASQSGTNGTKAKQVMTIEQAVDKIKSELPTVANEWNLDKFGSSFAPKYHTKEELAALKTPWVMVKGVLIEPSQTGIPESYRMQTNSGQTFWLHRAPELTKDAAPRTFAHFLVEVDGLVVQFLLDDKSSVEIQSFDIGRGGYFGNIRPSQASNQVVLINSDSTHDTFLGDVMLENQSTRSCVFSQSSISSRPRYTDHKAPWLDSNTGSRQKLKWSHVSRSTVYNSTLVDSLYLRDCAIDNSNIKTTETFRADTCTIKDSTIKGNVAELKFANLERTYIPSTGSVLIVNTRMLDESLGERPVYIPNKFSTLKIDLPYDHLFMRRESVKKVVLGTGYHKPVELDVDATLEETDAAVRAVLRGSSYHNPLDPDMKDPVVANLIHYVVQSLRSRLRVVKMLDSTVRTARVVTGEIHREDYDDDFRPRPF